MSIIGQELLGLPGAVASRSMGSAVVAEDGRELLDGEPLEVPTVLQRHLQEVEAGQLPVDDPEHNVGHLGHLVNRIFGTTSLSPNQRIERACVSEGYSVSDDDRPGGWTFPTGLVVNPMITIMVLARRVARTVLAET